MMPCLIFSQSFEQLEISETSCWPYIIICGIRTKHFEIYPKLCNIGIVRGNENEFQCCLPLTSREIKIYETRCWPYMIICGIRKKHFEIYPKLCNIGIVRGCIDEIIMDKIIMRQNHNKYSFTFYITTICYIFLYILQVRNIQKLPLDYYGGGYKFYLIG